MNIAFVPARGGSKSIPLKNIKDFCGKPLIYWCLNALAGSEAVDRIVIATDSRLIKEAINSFDLKRINLYDRDPANAEDSSSTESVILEYLEKCRDDYDDNDTFILVQATSPFTKSSDFRNAIELYRNGSYDSVLSVARMKRFFWDNSGRPINYDYMSRPRRQDFDGVLVENGAFYINSVANVKKSRNRLYGRIGLYEMPEYTVTEIDEPDDWGLAELLMRRHILSSDKLPVDVKLFAMDVDGVLTDAGMYYSETGDELKKFNTQDGKGIEILRSAGIKTAIITSENSNIVQRRCQKLRIDHLFQGVIDKLKIMKDLCERENLSLAEIAYIGDDINDLELLKSVGIAACPANAVKAIRSIPGIIVLNAAGGHGAVREFIELIYSKRK